MTTSLLAVPYHLGRKDIGVGRGPGHLLADAGDARQEIDRHRRLLSRRLAARPDAPSCAVLSPGKIQRELARSTTLAIALTAAAALLIPVLPILAIR